LSPSLVIEVKELTISFKTSSGEKKAVEHLNFKLHQGEIMAVVGESGSGKSVTAMSIMRLLATPPAVYNKGKIIFYHNNSAVNILCATEKEMQKIRGRHISMIFQEPMTSLNPVYTCGTQVSEIIRQHQNISEADAKKKVVQLFEEVLLPNAKTTFDKYPHQLSGGQKQRVMIAMAIANKPSVLIADEPTTALDVTVQKTILELLKSLSQKYNIAVLFITHDLGIVANIADKVLVMYEGRCVEENTTDKIFRESEHPYTKGLMACRPDTTKRIRVLPTVHDFMSHTPESPILNNLLSDSIKPSERAEKHSALYNEEPLIRINNLCKTFESTQGFLFKKKNGFRALNNVSFDVYKGETLGLVGESGCGKTTLGRTLLRLIEPDSGAVYYKGRNIMKLSLKEFRKLRRELQIVFQDPYSSLNPRLTIGQAIEEPMKVHRIYDTAIKCKQKCIELLEKVGLNETYYKRYPHELSGGQRQRMVIARTLALKPKFIICDESVSALDVSVQAQVLNLLNQLKNEFELTYIFISHDLSVVKYLADRIMIMKAGEIIETNEADALYANPGNAYTQKLIESIPKIVL